MGLFSGIKNFLGGSTPTTSTVGSVAHSNGTLKRRQARPDLVIEDGYMRHTISYTEFVAKFSNGLLWNPLFSQLTSRYKKEKNPEALLASSGGEIDHDELSMIVEEGCAGLDEDGNNSLEYAELAFILPNTKSIDWHTWTMICLGVVLYPFTAFYLLRHILSTPHQLFHQILVWWSEKRQWSLTSLYPYRVAAWAMLDVFHFDIRWITSPCGKFMGVLMVMALLFVNIFAVGVPIVYMIYIWFPYVIGPIMRGQYESALLDQGPTIVEAIFPLAEYFFLPTMIALVFVLNRERDGNRYALQQNLDSFANLEMVSTPNAFYTHSETMTIRTIVNRIMQGADHLGKTRSNKVFFILLSFFGPISLALSGSIMRLIFGLPYLGGTALAYLCGGCYDNQIIAQAFVVIGGQYVLYVLFLSFFSLLGICMRDIHQARDICILFSGLTTSPIESWAHELKPRYFKLDNQQNLVAWSRLRPFMLAIRNLEMQHLNIVIGLLASFLIWLFIVVVCIILHNFVLPGLLSSMQLKVYLLIILYGIFTYSIYAIVLMQGGVIANRLQTSDVKMLAKYKLEAFIGLSQVVNTKRDAEAPLSKEKEGLKYTLEHLIEFYDSILAKIKEDDDKISMLGIEITPALFVTMTLVIIVGVTTVLVVIAFPGTNQ